MLQGILAELQVEGAPGPRRKEPVTAGVPLSKGLLADSRLVQLFDARGSQVLLQAQTLDRWHDGSVRWLLVDFQADHDASDVRPCIYTLTSNESTEPLPATPTVGVSEGGGDILVDTGAARFTLRANGRFPFEDVRAPHASLIDPQRTQFVVEDASGRELGFEMSRLEVEANGPLRAVVRVDGSIGGGADKPLAVAIARLHFYAGSATVRFDLTLRNPRCATHPGGIWELGDEGSVHFRTASLIVAPAGAAGTISIGCSPEIDTPVDPCGDALELLQESSGGVNWKSPNHINRDGVVPFEFRGYRLRAGGAERTGLRATPVVTLTRGARELAIAMPRFWQNFPKAVEARSDAAILRLFPRQHGGLHELQGGEQKTHRVFVAFDSDRVSPLPLDWVRTPLSAHVTPAHYCESGAIPYLVTPVDDADPGYARLVNAAIEGNDTFAQKREAIDEYGWRNFGDVFADHEAVFHGGPHTLVSHYNNQYDGVAGLACQFMRTGDARWWSLFTDLADHVVDIDVYHTERDRPVYNHGLFWHTFHYVDAGKATHRGYPRAKGVSGGGPSPEHNYARGLLLHYWLTGAETSRQAVADLAQWVIDMDDGAQTPARWLTRSPTGWASATAGQHRPGRGAGNSIAVLLDGHRLTGDRAFLDKAEGLIRRCIHPADDLAQDDLLDAERRWSYTVFLHMLGKYLDYKAESGEVDAMYAYARESLLAYAAWMVTHERPYLDHPEKLEYPTETWAAQELWKSEVFVFAAKHAHADGRATFMERASFFFGYAITTLAALETRTLARPMFLLLSHGFMQGYMGRHLHAFSAPSPVADYNFGRPEAFEPQKAIAKRRIAALGSAGALIALAGLIYLAC